MAQFEPEKVDRIITDVISDDPRSHIPWSVVSMVIQQTQKMYLGWKKHTMTVTLSDKLLNINQEDRITLYEALR